MASKSPPSPQLELDTGSGWLSSGAPGVDAGASSACLKGALFVEDGGDGGSDGAPLKEEFGPLTMEIAEGCFIRASTAVSIRPTIASSSKRVVAPAGSQTAVAGATPGIIPVCCSSRTRISCRMAA
eukprot:scaffold7016_cov123-Isochrysis_galbana.AAC.14